MILSWRSPAGAEQRHKNMTKMCSVGGSLWPCTSFQMAPTDPQLGAAVHPHLSSWIWAVSGSVLHFYLQGRRFMTFHAVRCAGDWASALLRSGSWHLWDVLRDLCDCFELDLSFPNNVSQPHDSFQFQEGKTKTFSSDDSSGQQIRGKNKIHIRVNVWINPATFFLTFWYDFGTPSFPLTGTHFKLSIALLVWEGLFGIAVCTAESQSWLPWLHAKQWLIKISCCSRHSVDNNPHHSKGNVC